LALPVGGLEVKPYALAVGLVVGIGVTLVAARSSVRRASSVAPIEALRASAVESTAVSRPNLGTTVAVGCRAGGYGGGSSGSLLPAAR
jgi:putative ABC transport system permease protein